MSDQLISLEQAKALITSYKENKDTLLCEQYQATDVLPNCETFDRDAIDQLLAQDGCTGVRVYFGMDENMLVKVVLVGVDENDQDILNDGEMKIVEQGTRCPVVCPPDSELNN